MARKEGNVPLQGTVSEQHMNKLKEIGDAYGLNISGVIQRMIEQTDLVSMWNPPLSEKHKRKLQVMADRFGLTPTGVIERLIEQYDLFGIKKE